MDLYLEGLLNDLGIEATDDDGRYLSMSDIFTMIANKWDAIDDKTQDRISKRLIKD